MDVIVIAWDVYRYMMPLSLVYKSLQMYLARMFQIELPGSEANH